MMARAVPGDGEGGASAVAVMARAVARGFTAYSKYRWHCSILRIWPSVYTILLWLPPATRQELGTTATTGWLFLTTSWGLPTSTARLYSARCAESLKTPRRPTWEWRSRARIISEHGETSDSVHVNVSEVREHAPSHSHPSEPSNPPPRLYIPM